MVFSSTGAPTQPPDHRARKSGSPGSGIPSLQEQPREQTSPNRIALDAKGVSAASSSKNHGQHFREALDMKFREGVAEDLQSLQISLLYRHDTFLLELEQLSTAVAETRRAKMEDARSFGYERCHTTSLLNRQETALVSLVSNPSMEELSQSALLATRVQDAKNELRHQATTQFLDFMNEKLDKVEHKLTDCIGFRTGGTRRRKPNTYLRSGTMALDKPVDLFEPSVPFIPWPVWRKSPSDTEKMKNAVQRVTTRNAGEQSALLNMVRSSSEFLNGQCILNPNSNWRLAWEILGVSFLCYDVVQTPLMAFEIKESMFVIAMNWVTMLYWTVDLITMFRLGYHGEHGKLTMDARDIALNYISTWFIFDAAVVIIDWIVNLQGSLNSGRSLMKSTKLIRSLRVLRFIRLLRLAKLRHYTNLIRMHIDSQYLFLALSILQHLLFLLVVNHLIACFWYWIGTTAAEERSWLQKYNLGHETVLYKYTTSLHWSLTQFTPASMDVQPQNLPERSFAVVVLIFAMIFFGSFISSITSAITALRQLHMRYEDQFWLLRKYLREQKISKDTSMRVTRYLTYAVSRHRSHVQEDQVEILDMLSSALYARLKKELFSATLYSHPFFEAFGRLSVAALDEVCKSAVQQEHLSKADSLFRLSEDAHHMFFVVEGQLCYERMGDVQGTLRRPATCCEAVLWMPWTHCGEMWAKTESAVVTCDSVKFREAVSQHPSDFPFARHYCLAFTRYLTQTREQGDEVNDILPADMDREEVTRIMTEVLAPNVDEEMVTSLATAAFYVQRPNPDGIEGETAMNDASVSACTSIIL